MSPTLASAIESQARHLFVGILEGVLPPVDPESPIAPLQPVFVSERGQWLRWLIAALLTINIALFVISIEQTNQNQDISEDSRSMNAGQSQLLCAMEAVKEIPGDIYQRVCTSPLLELEP